MVSLDRLMELNHSSLSSETKTSTCREISLFPIVSLKLEFASRHRIFISGIQVVHSLHHTTLRFHQKATNMQFPVPYLLFLYPKVLHVTFLHHLQNKTTHDLTLK